MNRRHFLHTTAAAFPFVAPATVLGANDRLQVGVIGLGGRAPKAERFLGDPEADRRLSRTRRKGYELRSIS